MSDILAEVQSIWTPPAVERIVGVTHFEDMIIIATESCVYKMKISRLTSAAVVVDGKRLV